MPRRQRKPSKSGGSKTKAFLVFSALLGVVSIAETMLDLSYYVLLALDAVEMTGIGVIPQGLWAILGAVTLLALLIILAAWIAKRFPRGRRT